MASQIHNYTCVRATQQVKEEGVPGAQHPAVIAAALDGQGQWMGAWGDGLSLADMPPEAVILVRYLLVIAFFMS